MQQQKCFNVYEGLHMPNCKVLFFLHTETTYGQPPYPTLPSTNMLFIIGDGLNLIHQS